VVQRITLPGGTDHLTLQAFTPGLKNWSMVAEMPPYSTVRSVTAPDMQIVVVPPTSTSAINAMAKVSFMARPLELRKNALKRQKDRPEAGFWI
jgi:hypothetical protein